MKQDLVGFFGGGGRGEGEGVFVISYTENKPIPAYHSNYGLKFTVKLYIANCPSISWIKLQLCSLPILHSHHSIEIKVPQETEFHWIESPHFYYISYPFSIAYITSICLTRLIFLSSAITFQLPTLQTSTLDGSFCFYSLFSRQRSQCQGQVYVSTLPSCHIREQQQGISSRRITWSAHGLLHKGKINYYCSWNEKKHVDRFYVPSCSKYVHGIVS